VEAVEVIVPPLVAENVPETLTEAVVTVPVDVVGGLRARSTASR
jgi:hypothetical protein